MGQVKSENKAVYNSGKSGDDIIKRAIAILGARMAQTEFSLTSADDTRKFVMLKLAEREHEVFAVIFMDNRHRVIEYKEMFRGTIDGASVHPREVAKEALSTNAAAVIFVHNHPSGVAEPSRADETITVRLKDALALFDVRVLDHIIVGGTDIVSFAERGIL